MLLNSSAFCAIMMKGFELMLEEVSRGPARAATVEERMTKQLRTHILLKAAASEKGGDWLLGKACHREI